MYSLESYGHMLTDERRHQALMSALEHAIKPGDIVLEIGTGFGFYALVAAKLGAAVVYAIEPNPLVALGPMLAKANGLADRIEFIEGISTDITLPQRADVIFSDLRGVMPFLSRHLPSIHDARQRHLAPGGLMIPTEDTIFAAVSFDPEFDEHGYRIWTDGRFGLDLSPAAARAADGFESRKVQPENIRSAAVEIGRVDYARIEANGLDFEGTATISQAGAANGLSLWFDTVCLPDGPDGQPIGYSTTAANQPMVYGMGFLPFGEPVDLVAGAVVDVAIRCDLLEDSYVWTWSVGGTDAGGQRWQRAHSNFAADLLSASALAPLRESHAIGATDKLVADQQILALLAAGGTLGAVAGTVQADHGALFASIQHALDHVTVVAARYRS